MIWKQNKAHIHHIKAQTSYSYFSRLNPENMYCIALPYVTMQLIILRKQLINTMTLFPLLDGFRNPFS